MTTTLPKPYLRSPTPAEQGPYWRDRDSLARPRAAVPLAADLAVGSAPPSEPAQRRRSRRPASELGGALGLAILGTVGTAVYRDRTADAFPDEVPVDAAGTASDTLAGAVAVADRLPLHAADVLQPAREAFTQALQAAATVSGVLAVAAAVMVVRLLRQGDDAQESKDRAAPSVAIATQQPCA